MQKTPNNLYYWLLTRLTGGATEAGSGAATGSGVQRRPFIVTAQTDHRAAN